METHRFDEEPTQVDPSIAERAQLAELPEEYEPNAPRVLW
jgi:hypothetical protein